VRTSTVSLLFGLLAALGSDLAPAFAAERQVFRYGNGVTGGALIHDYSTRWVEFVGSDEKYGFEEKGRSNDSIELIDRSRDIGLRVHGEKGEIRLANSTAWQPWALGKWIRMDELPSSIRFVPTDQKIRLAYFVPKDRMPIAPYEQKIRVVMQVVADVFSDLQAKGYRSAGLTFETNSQGEPIVHLIRGEKPAQYYNDAPAYDEGKHFVKISGEIPAEVGSPRRHMIMLFPETYEPGPAPVEWRGSVGRGGRISTDGGVAMISAWILQVAGQLSSLLGENHSADVLEGKCPSAGCIALSRAGNGSDGQLAANRGDQVPRLSRASAHIAGLDESNGRPRASDRRVL
jgi:hypothetical protein